MGTKRYLEEFRGEAVELVRLGEKRVARIMAECGPGR